MSVLKPDVHLPDDDDGRYSSLSLSLCFLSRTLIYGSDFRNYIENGDSPLSFSLESLFFIRRRRDAWWCLAPVVPHSTFTPRLPDGKI